MSLTLVLISILLFAGGAAGQRRAPEIVAELEGEPVYQVLPANAIPAILQPEFLSGQPAEEQMRAEEPVLGVEINSDTRAYSLWQLDHHEIVNDVVGNTAIAVTW